MKPKQLLALAKRYERKADKLKAKAEKLIERDAFAKAGVKPGLVVKYNRFTWKVKYSEWRKCLVLSRESGGCAWGRRYTKDINTPCPFLQKYLAGKSASPFTYVCPEKARAEAREKRQAICFRTEINGDKYRIRKVMRQPEFGDDKAAAPVPVFYLEQKRYRDYLVRNTFDALDAAKAELVAIRIIES